MKLTKIRLKRRRGYPPDILRLGAWMNDAGSYGVHCAFGIH